MGTERGHRTLVITRKGGKVVTIPLAPRTARAIDLATGERTDGPMFLGAGGKRLDRHGAARIVRRVTRRAGISKKVSPHTMRHAFITAAQMSIVASGASFRIFRVHALPAAQRATCGCSQRDGARRTTPDLGCHQPVAVGRTMMQPVLLCLMTT
jgi:integrase